MFLIVLILVLTISSICDQCEVNARKDATARLVDRITGCSFINNNVESVELICDNIAGYLPQDNCHSELFQNVDNCPSENQSQIVGQSKVKHLKLHHCKTEMFHANQFEILTDIFPNVIELDLRFVGIHSMLYFGTEFKELKVLDISHNTLESIFLVSFFLGNFEEINLSFNGFKKLKNLELDFDGRIIFMNFSHNSIIEIASTFLKDVKELRIIDLSSNKLEFLDTNVFSGVSKTLQIILLQNNRFKRFTQNFAFFFGDKMTSLEQLNLSWNQITNYTHIWTKRMHSNLQNLNLSHNNLSSFTIADNFIRNLKTLDLSFNQLQTFNYSSINHLSLKELNVEGNKLDELDTITFAKCPNLTTINIAKNRISCEYVKKFVQQWNDLQVITDDLCDKKSADNPHIHSGPNSGTIVDIGNGDGVVNNIEDENSNGNYKMHIISTSVAAVFACIVIAVWITHRKIVPKKPKLIEQINVLYKSSNQYEEPMPHEEPFYYEIGPPVPNDEMEQYDHLSFRSLPLSPVNLFNDNLKYEKTDCKGIKKATPRENVDGLSKTSLDMR